MQSTAKKRINFERLKSLSLYKKVLIVYSLVLVLLVIASQIVVWSFLASYQKGQSDSFAEKYVNSITETEWKEMISGKVYGSDYQDKTDVINAAYDLYFRGKDFNCRRSPTESKGDTNVYKASNNGVTLCSFMVIKDGEGAYGMPRWKISSFEMTDEFFDAVNPKTTVYVPIGSVLKVNEIAVDKLYFSECISPFASELEKGMNSNFWSYTFRAPCGEYDLSATNSGTELKLEDIESNVYGFDTTDVKNDITVSAPGGSEVYVNGIRLNTGYITEKNVKYPFLNPLEEELSDVPSSTIYKVNGLYNKPDIRVVYNNEELICSTSSNENMYIYPFLVSGSDYLITVPVGAAVKVNGIDITLNDEFVTEDDSVYSDISAYKDELVNPLVCKVYSLKGMFFEPKIDITGADSVKYKVLCEEKYNYRCDIEPDVSDVDEYKELAEKFGVSMMEYMFYGREYLNTGFNNVLRQTRKGSNAYTAVYGSYAGMYWRAAHTIKYNKLYADNFVRYADNAFRCDIHYDVTGTRLTSTRTETASGIYRVIYVNNGTRWEIVELSLLNESE